jgi:hypothetical protein
MKAGESDHNFSAIVVYPHAGSLVCCIRTIGQVSFLRYSFIGNECNSLNPRGNQTKTHCLINISFSIMVLSASKHHNDLHNKMMFPEISLR